MNCLFPLLASELSNPMFVGNYFLWNSILLGPLFSCVHSLSHGKSGKGFCAFNASGLVGKIFSTGLLLFGQWLEAMDPYFFG